MKNLLVSSADFVAAPARVALHPASLLVPSDFLPRLNSRLQDFNGSLNSYLYFLLDRQNSDALKLPANTRKLTARYQNPGLELVPKHFRVDPALWHALKCIARTRGISVCLAFMILCRQDLRTGVRVLTFYYQLREKFRETTIEINEILKIGEKTARRREKITSPQKE